MVMSVEKLYIQLYLKELFNLSNKTLIINYYIILKLLKIFQKNFYQNFAIKFKIKHLPLKILFLML